jgi:hypothetical protein
MTTVILEAVLNLLLSSHVKLAKTRYKPKLSRGAYGGGPHPWKRYSHVFCILGQEV